MKIAGENATPLEVRFGGYSTAGVKPENEDAFAAHQPSLGVRNLKGAVACIADGVSCSDNAQQASHTSVTQFIEDYYSTPETWPVKTAAARVLSSMNSWLFSYGQNTNLPHNGLVTTFSVAVFKSTTAHIFHVGDSRVYRFRDDTVQQLSRDHTHKQSGSKVFLTRALGMDSRLEVDYLQEDVQVGDVFLLTTDGVHEFVHEQDFVNQLKELDTGLETMAKALVALAAERGSQDNLSCLLVKIDSLPKEEIDEVHRELTQLKIPPAMSIGNSIDGYEVLDVLHSGTRSHVYLVNDKGSNKVFVLKAPSENFAEDPLYLEGFIREQWIGRRIDSPHVMKIYERPENSPFLYHLCEYVKGRTLRQWMHDNPVPPIETVRDILKSTVTALRVFQRLGMMHRDLKPENLIIDERGQVKIIDFGTVLVQGLQEIQTALEEEVPVGSVNYVAPEYVMGNTHPSSDLFSLGVMVYEMLSGTLPFQAALAQRFPKHFSDWRYSSIRAHRKDIPEWINLALKKATEPDPRNRYQALSELMQDLREPNQSLVSFQQKAPLLERNPLRFWQLLSLTLLVVLIVQFVYFSS